MLSKATAYFISVPTLSIRLSGFLIIEMDGVFVSCRELGRGLVTETVQRFIWDHCISKAVKIPNHLSSISLFELNSIYIFCLLSSLGI